MDAERPFDLTTLSEATHLREPVRLSDPIALSINLSVIARRSFASQSSQKCKS